MDAEREGWKEIRGKVPIELFNSNVLAARHNRKKLFDAAKVAKEKLGCVLV